MTKNEDEGNLGLAKKQVCGTTVFFSTFMIPQQECSDEVSRSVWTHDKIILACSGVFCSRKNRSWFSNHIS